MTHVNKQTGLIGAIHGCASWQDIQAKWWTFPEKQKGDLFEELVKAYLQLEPEYASKLKHVWLGGEVPQAIAKKLKLPATDQGIDIVAETHDGEFWAIQCKYRQETNHSLTWRDLSTFTGLAFGVCRGFSFGIICSTTERITHVLKDQDRIGFCALDVWQALDADFLKRLRAHLAYKPALLKPLKPMPHQKSALKDGHRHFVIGKSTRGKLIMPCGSGKSLTAYWIAGELESRRIVIAVPSLALIRQTLKVWLRETQANQQSVEWICVCSDESAGRVERDDSAVLRQDLGVPCLTDPKEIASWLKRKHRGLTVVFTTYQSGEALAKAARAARFTFDLGIMDEAHKTVGDGEKLFSHLLHDKNLPIRRRLFMTATERRYKGQSDTVLSMDDPATYGETFHLLSFKRAMEYDPPILSDYKIISIAVSREEVAELIRKNTFVRPDKGPWNEEIEADMLASLIALRKAMEKYPIQHAVSFHGSIQRAELFKTHNDAFSKSFRNYGKLETFHVSGKTPTGTRARVIGEFARAERALITNARCLTEGVDVPGIDCVLFADPRRSAVDIVQAVGRALRPAPGKQFGYVIVPILHDADATTDDIFKSPAFKEILTTLRALAANDDRIIEYFRGVSQGRQRKGGGSVQFDIDERLAKQINLDDFAREIELKCWDKLAKLSWRPFEEAREFTRSLKLSNHKGWMQFCQSGERPPEIPSNPQAIYKNNGWIGWGDWFGTGYMAHKDRQWRAFDEARAFIRSLKLTNHEEWLVFCRSGDRSSDIPSNPQAIYKENGWIDLGDWLGTGYVAKRQWRPFGEARAFARSLQLANGDEWREYCRSGNRPDDIPSCPQVSYKHNGWIGWGDWLGTGTTSNSNRQWRSFDEARAFARSLKLFNGDEWREYCRSGKRPDDIPSNPESVYKANGWIGWGDWLGTGNLRNRQWRPFIEARAFARSLKLSNHKEWMEFCRSGERPDDIPSAPQRSSMANEWVNWSDWLGTGNRKNRQWRPFDEARAFARSLMLANTKKWRDFSKSGKRPDDIPADPESTFKANGWIGWGDWLGTGNFRNRQWRPFFEARAFVRSLRFSSRKSWLEFSRSGERPDDIPSNPNFVYQDDGWKGMGDWLGTGNLAPKDRQWRSFDKARAFARSLKLSNHKEWMEFRRSCECPSDIPSKPQVSYKNNGWIDWGDWLGTGNTSNSKRQWRSFDEARAFARSLKLSAEDEWREYCKSGKRPDDIPANPSKTYKDEGWAGMSDWLSTDLTRVSKSAKRKS